MRHTEVSRHRRLTLTLLHSDPMHTNAWQSAQVRGPTGVHRPVCMCGPTTTHTCRRCSGLRQPSAEPAQPRCCRKWLPGAAGWLLQSPQPPCWPLLQPAPGSCLPTSTPCEPCCCARVHACSGRASWRLAARSDSARHQDCPCCADLQGHSMLALSCPGPASTASP